MKAFDLANPVVMLPDDLSPDEKARAKTMLFKELALACHGFYRGKMMSVPRAGLYGPAWFNVWYTPGVSKISTTIRDHPERAFDLSGRGNLVAVVSDSTRVLGDGDVTPAGGLGVMEGKAFLMKYLGGLDATALCVDNRDAQGRPDPDKVIQFVEMLQPSVGAVNLEDISQPNCYHVLDTLQQSCSIPVWHDDAQGTGCVVLAGLINALKVAGKSMKTVRIVFLGTGAANSTIAKLLFQAGADPQRAVLFNTGGALDTDRGDLESNPAFYRQWDLCQRTNPDKIKTMEEAIKGADVLIACSKPGPKTIKARWIRTMADKAIVFTLANPIPEIYPYAAQEAGAFITATGRGDFPNQVNNSLGFPGILKGATLSRATRITDTMAIAGAHALARHAEKKGLSPTAILPGMDEANLFEEEAAAVAMQAVKDGVAQRKAKSWDYYREAQRDIQESRRLFQHLMDSGFIPTPPEKLIRKVVNRVVADIRPKQP